MDSTTTKLNANQRKRNVNHLQLPPVAKRKAQLSSLSSNHDNGGSGSGSSSGSHESAAMAEIATVAATVVKSAITCGCMEDTIAYLDSFPVGYRFNPTDEELITHYLLRKIRNLDLPKNKIGDVAVYEHHPEKIVENHPQAEEGQWYFFSPRNRKYTNGSRPNRKAGDGYWKASGADKEITDDNGVKIGDKRSLVYHEGRAPKGIKSDWVMHEYVVAGHQRRRLGKTDMKLDDFVLCRIYKNEKRGRGQANPNQVVSDHQQQHSNNQDGNPTPNGHGDNNTQMFYDSSNRDHHPQGEEPRVPIPNHEPRSKRAVLLPRVDQQPNPRNLHFKNNEVVPNSLSYCHCPTMGLQNPLRYHPDHDMRFRHQVAPPVIPLPPPPYHPFCSIPSYMLLPQQSCYRGTSDFNRTGFNYIDQPPLRVAAPPPYQAANGGGGGDGSADLIEFSELGLSEDDLNLLGFDEIERYQSLKT